MSVLDRVAIRVAPLSNRIVLARFGKDQNVALETKDAMNAVFQAVVQYAFDGKMPEKGEKVEISFGGAGEQFTMLIERKGGAA